MEQVVFLGEGGQCTPAGRLGRASSASPGHAAQRFHRTGALRPAAPHLSLSPTHNEKSGDTGNANYKTTYKFIYCHFLILYLKNGF